MNKMINPRHDIKPRPSAIKKAYRSGEIYFSSAVAFYFLLTCCIQSKEWSFYIILSREFLAHVSFDLYSEYMVTTPTLSC